MLRLTAEAGALAVSGPRLHRRDDFDCRSEAKVGDGRTYAHAAPRHRRLVHARIGSQGSEFMGGPRSGGSSSANDYVPAVRNLCGDKIAEDLSHGRCSFNVVRVGRRLLRQPWKY